MLAVSHAPGLLVAAQRNTPDCRVIAGLFIVDRNLHEGHAFAIGRDLRIADPVELEDIFLSDGTFLRLRENGNRSGQKERDSKKLVRASPANVASPLRQEHARNQESETVRRRGA